MPAIRLLAMLLAGLALLGTGTPAATATATYSRLYLLAAETNYLYWSVDPTDPELTVPVTTIRCGAAAYLDVVPATSKPCLSGLAGESQTYNLFFFPHTLLDETARWSASEPLRFHVRARVDAPVDSTLSLVLQRGATQFVSPPATEVAPDVWEGTLPSGGQMQSADPPLLGLRVTTASPGVTIELHAAGASWVELPAPVRARPVTTLLAESPPPVAPGRYETETHRLTFNDAEWEARSFDGDLSEARRFEVQLDRPAPLVYAWVEGYESPFLHDTLRGRQPDARKLTDSPILRLLVGGQPVVENGFLLIGSPSVATHNVPATSIEVEVEPNGSLTEQTYPYTVHLVAIYGQRTLRRLESDFSLDGAWDHTPVSQSCPFRGIQPIPVTSAVSTFDVRLFWDDAVPRDARWTLEYWIPNVGAFHCGEGGTGPRVRFTMPLVTDVWWMGPTPVQTTFVSAADTVFSIRVDYAYTPPPAG